MPEDYNLELKEGLQEYNGCTLCEPLEHVNTHHAPMDDAVYHTMIITEAAMVI